MLDLFLAAFAIVRLGEGVFCLWMGLRYRRYAVATWGGMGVLLSIPLVAIALGWNLPPGPLVALAGGAAIQGMCVVAAMVSSTAEARRVAEIMERGGIPSFQPNRWRP